MMNTDFDRIDVSDFREFFQSIEFSGHKILEKLKFVELNYKMNQTN